MKRNRGTNYKRGVRSEYAFIKKLKEAGYQTFRSAGSHGPYDVIALDNKTLFLIQVKTSRGKSSEKSQKKAGMDDISSVKPRVGRTLSWFKVLVEYNIEKRKGNWRFATLPDDKEAIEKLNRVIKGE